MWARMGPSAPPVQVALLLILSSLHLCQASMAAWMTDIGPQVILQDPASGKVMYTDCNSWNTPIYSADPTKSFKLSYPPRNGTALAGVGWFNSKITVTSFFYQTTDGRLINGYYECDMNTGLFSSKGNFVISDDSPSIHNQTGLAGLVLGDTAGYRVFFHDKDQNMCQITYNNDDGWRYGGIISQSNSSSMAMGAVFHDTKNFNMSVVTPFDENNFEISRFNTDKTWHVTTAPRPLKGVLVTNSTNRSNIEIDGKIKANFVLPAWNGKPKAIGISTDSARTRSVWYLGTDNHLHQTANINYTWQLYPNQTDKYWPLADIAGGDLAVASNVDTSEVHIYYFVKNNLTEVKYVNGGWQPASGLPNLNTTGTTNTTTDGSSGTAAPGGGDSSLSAGAKAGIGVGVSLGVLALGGTFLALWFFRRRAAREDAAAKAAQQQQYQQQQYQQQQQQQHGAYSDYGSQQPYGSPHSAWGTEYKEPGHDGYTHVPHGELDTAPVAMEMDSAPRPMYELPDQTFNHELAGSQPTTPFDSPTAGHVHPMNPSPLQPQGQQQSHYSPPHP